MSVNLLPSTVFQNEASTIFHKVTTWKYKKKHVLLNQNKANSERLVRNSPSLIPRCQRLYIIQNVCVGHINFWISFFNIKWSNGNSLSRERTSTGLLCGGDAFCTHSEPPWSESSFPMMNKVTICSGPHTPIDFQKLGVADNRM